MLTFFRECLPLHKTNSMRKIRIVKNYMSLVKFSHTLFAMPFALVGYFLGAEVAGFSMKLLGLVVLCMVFARNAAMAFNRFVDKEFDKANERTQNREIPAGTIHPKSALFFIILNSVLFILTTWFINSRCFYLSPVALIVILGYSFTKRFTALSHLVLGLGLSLAPIGAYLAATGEFAIVPIMLSIMVLFWVSGFDIIYSLQDESFDKSNKLFSIPAYFGAKHALWVSRIFHIIAGAMCISIMQIIHLKVAGLISSILFLSLLLYQHLLVKHDDLKKVNLAFFTLNGIASVLYAGGIITDLIFTF